MSTQSAYLELQKASGIKIGDKVKVLRDYNETIDDKIAPSSTQFWECKSEEVYAVTNVDGHGIEIDNEQWVPCYVVEVLKSVISHELNDDYTATLDEDEQTISVGCQEFSFKTVLDLADKIRPLYKELPKKKRR